MPGRKPRDRRLTAAQADLAAANVRLAYKEARKLWASSELARRLPSREDCEQEALRGLCRAAEGFRPELGFRFSTYATRCIRRAVLEAARDAGLIRVPRYLQEGGRVDRTSPGCRRAAALVLQVWQMPADDGGEELEPAAPEAPDAAELAEALGRLAEALRSLSPRQREALRLCFGLDGLGERTYAEAGRQLGVCRERVRQLRERALVRLFREMRRAA